MAPYPRGCAPVPVGLAVRLDRDGTEGLEVVLGIFLGWPLRLLLQGSVSQRHGPSQIASHLIEGGTDQGLIPVRRITCPDESIGQSSRRTLVEGLVRRAKRLCPGTATKDRLAGSPPGRHGVAYAGHGNIGEGEDR